MNLADKAKEISDCEIVEELFKLNIPYREAKEHVYNLGKRFRFLYKKRLKKGIVSAKEEGLSFLQASRRINEYVFVY